LFFSLNLPQTSAWGFTEIILVSPKEKKAEKSQVMPMPMPMPMPNQFFFLNGGVNGHSPDFSKEMLDWGVGWGERDLNTHKTTFMMYNHMATRLNSHTAVEQNGLTVDVQLSFTCQDCHTAVWPYSC